MDSLQRSEETLFTLDAFEQNPPNHIFSIARSAQALSARGIVPDIIFAADIQDLNIAFFDGLKADFYRCILTFIQSWKSALKS